jgi:hypothetical protein
MHAHVVVRRILVALSLTVVGAGCAAAGGGTRSDGAAAAAATGRVTTTDEDLKSLQGRWERPMADDVDGTRGASRVVKEVRGDHETVTYYDDAGKPVHATTADFKLQRAGRVKLYTFSNLKVTLGRDRGGPPRRPLTYIYRLDGDVYYEGHGLLADAPEDATPNVVRWERVKG